MTVKSWVKRVLLFENCSAFTSILVGAYEKNSSLMRAIMNKIIFIFNKIITSATFPLFIFFISVF